MREKKVESRSLLRSCTTPLNSPCSRDLLIPGLLEGPVPAGGVSFGVGGFDLLLESRPDLYMNTWNIKNMMNTIDQPVITPKGESVTISIIRVEMNAIAKETIAQTMIKKALPAEFKVSSSMNQTCAAQHAFVWLGCDLRFSDTRVQ
jgi:hypothetical protein